MLRVDKSPGPIIHNTITTLLYLVIHLNTVALKESESLGHGHYLLYPIVKVNFIHNDIAVRNFHCVVEEKLQPCPMPKVNVIMKNYFSVIVQMNA